MKFIKKILLVLFILCISINVVACDKKSEKENLTKVELATLDLDIYQVPLLIAINNGFFEEEGLDVKIRNYPNENLIFDEISRGNVPVALISGDSIISNYEKSNSPIFFASFTHKNASYLVQRPKDQNLDFDNLEGTSILCDGINNTNILSFNYLCNKEDENFSEEINKISNVDSANIENAFRSGTGDLALVNSQSAYNLDSTSDGKIVCSMGEKVGQSLNKVFVSNENYIQDNPEIIQKFTNAIYKAQIFMGTRSLEEISAITISNFSTLDKKTLFNCIKEYKDINLWNSSPKVREDDYDKMIEICSSTLENSEKKPPKYEVIVDNSFADNSIKNIKK